MVAQNDYKITCAPGEEIIYMIKDHDDGNDMEEMVWDGSDADCFTGQRADAHFFHGGKNSFSGFKPCFHSNVYRLR